MSSNWELQDFGEGCVLSLVVRNLNQIISFTLLFSSIFFFASYLNQIISFLVQWFWSSGCSSLADKTDFLIGWELRSRLFRYLLLSGFVSVLKYLVDHLLLGWLDHYFFDWSVLSLNKGLGSAGFCINWFLYRGLSLFFGLLLLWRQTFQAFSWGRELALWLWHENFNWGSGFRDLLCIVREMTGKCLFDILLMLQLSLWELSLFNWGSLLGFFFDRLEMSTESFFDVLFLLSLGGRFPRLLLNLGLGIILRLLLLFYFLLLLEGGLS